ncbi:phospholipid-transporting ATPase IA-like isoform X1 [Dendronephthya gigantea]|uniref:phospholipid-transporting ATPase IA-like isoform X1 n=1 Tax=Dendronephthya gigantea TaxID=151771 RepID=UPI00106AF608|nr:phospholipid-transporting ATPase IA-like isoform X1 [Dendronephthya gigantea]
MTEDIQLKQLSDERGNYGTVDDGGQDEADRVIMINSPQNVEFCGNKISTAKYNLITFLPKFLLEQFSRYSNVFFLFIALLQQIEGVSPTGRYTTAVPLLFVLSCSAVKEIIEDYKRHRADDKTNKKDVRVWREDAYQTVKWMELKVGDIVKVVNGQFFPADLMLLSSSEPMGMCYIETANLDGETNLKIKQALPLTANMVQLTDLKTLEGRVDCEGPNNRLYEFVGNITLNGKKAVPLNPDQLLLRGAQLRNTQWIYGLVVYTGHDSKLMQNSTAAPIKRSNMDRATNLQILFLFCLLMIMAFFSSLGSYLWTKNQRAGSWYMGYEGRKPQSFFFTIITFIILYNNLIPISLPVTLEIVKFIQAIFINSDCEMYYDENDTPAMARTSNLNEELGQVKYIFSDKTGTLTRNIMEFRKCSIAGIMYGGDGDTYNDPSLLDNLREHHPTSSVIREFLTLLSVCHTVVPERDTQNPDKIIYQAASPDEGALVEGAKLFGFSFNVRTPTSVIINAMGQEEVYEVLNVLEFNSTRKRMSVIMKTPSGQIKLYCKGADTVIYERLGTSQLYKDVTLKHLEEFAKDGLRTLCISMAEISQEEYDRWSDIYYRASTSLENRDEKVDEAAELIEKNLFLLGATAIEDKLQEGVPDSIADLAAANIKIWVLTGDKQETAINIGYSCKLLTEDMSLLICNECDLGGTKRWLDEIIKKYGIKNKRKKEPKRGEEERLALIVTGQTLNYALEEDLKYNFLDLALCCKAVVCCRVSPLQKAQVVRLVKSQVKNSVTLAIGDGANDVGMIQAAHVGVGISGQEGLQAASASDYAIAQFRFLNKLLLVHGSWSYQRLSKLILYSFYKNVCLYVIELWFALDNGFSGQILFDKWCIGIYNVAFTAFPPLAIGLFDKTVSSDSLQRFPQLYKPSQNAEYFNTKVFWLWIFAAVVHSLLLFYLPSLALNNDVPFQEGLVVGNWFVGNVVYTLVVVTVCLKAALELDSWNLLCHIAIWGSILSWFIFLLIYCQPFIAEFLAPDMIGQEQMIFTCPGFWFMLILIPVITLFFDFCYKLFNRTFRKTLAQEIQEIEERRSDPQSSLGLSTPSVHRSAFRSKSFKNQHGYAFSQEESASVRQAQLIRRYDTNLKKPGGGE